MNPLCKTLFCLISLVSISLFAKQPLRIDQPLPAQIEKKSLGKTFSSPFVNVAKSCIPAVVFIRVEGGTEHRYDPNDLFSDEFFRHFFGGPRRSPGPQISQGSGFLVSKEGHIMTNFHVVRGAKKITVHLQDGTDRQVSATYIGGDPRTDIAVIQINDAHGQDFPYLELGNSDKLEVGEWVVAIGNPFSLEASVSAGIISAKGRQGLQITDYEDFIQTDAAINPGNSGGPLIDLDKKVIGMNTAILTGSGYYVGIGFAIPSNILINIKNQLVENGIVTRGFLGVSLQPIDRDLAEAFQVDSTQGALIVEVVEGSPADKAGIRQGDIVLQINGSPVKNINQLRNDILLLPPGTQVKLMINRNRKIVHFNVTLGQSGSNALISSTTACRQLGLAIDNLTIENIQRYRLNQENKGVVIVGIDPGSPADAAGMSPGCLIEAVNHIKVTNVKEFNDAIATIKTDDRILLLTRQKGIMKFYTLKAQ